MRTYFPLKTIALPKNVMCKTQDHRLMFWPRVEMAQDRYRALFDWSQTEDFWKSDWLAEIEHEGLNPDGTPINPVMVAIRELVI